MKVNYKLNEFDYEIIFSELIYIKVIHIKRNDWPIDFLFTYKNEKINWGAYSEHLPQEVKMFVENLVEKLYKMKAFE